MVIALTFITTVSFAQQAKLDSLLLEYRKHHSDSSKIKLLQKICTQFYYTDSKAGLIYLDTLMLLSKKTRDYKMLTFGNRYKANLLITEGKFGQAISLFKKNVQILEGIGQKKNLYSDYLNIGTTYRYARNFKQAELYYEKCIEIIEKYGRKDKYIVVYNNLGGMAFSEENFEKAIKYYVKALEHKDFNKNPRRYINTLTNLSVCHYELKQYGKGIKYAQEGLKISKEIDFTIGIADNKKNLGKCLKALEVDLYKAIEYFKQAIDLYKKLSDNVFLIEAYSNLGETYEKIKNYPQAIVYHKNALELSQRIEMKDNVLSSKVFLSRALFQNGKVDQSERYINQVLNQGSSKYLLKTVLASVYKTKADIRKSKRDYKNALIYYEKYKVLSDSLLSAEKLKDINEIETKYETQKKEAENAKLIQLTAQQELELEIENKRKWFFAIGLATSITILTVFFYFYRKNQKQKKIIEKLQRELHHRIKNNLAIIDTFIDTAKDGMPDKKGKQKLSELQNRIESIYKVHELLYKTKGRITQVSAKEYIGALIKGVQQSFSDKPVTILMDIGSEVTFEVEQSFPVGLIVNEFLTNSYKYAFKGRNDGTVTISITAQGKYYRIDLADNGIGLPKDFDLNSVDTFGMDVIKLLAEQLGGSFELNGADGVKFHCSFEKK
ncbi:tetratricopeptide repeat-containing sensor histidine kinase [Pseudotenacibaculum haliotis]|uniref:Tetratricopeptide repeat protein n=1 Tax=Pseudotenacibaculum haliotis TaxID=1862138 RepID=A0ABW5LNC1_9FLAO